MRPKVSKWARQGGLNMKTLRTGVIAATLVVASFASAPIASAEKCPILVGPDWSGESLSPDPARLLSISDVYHARMIYEPFIGVDSAMQPTREVDLGLQRRELDDVM
jgi:hypothetical protein